MNMVKDIVIMNGHTVQSTEYILGYVYGPGLLRSMSHPVGY